jgi:hypothetical protein
LKPHNDVQITDLHLAVSLKLKHVSCITEIFDRVDENSDDFNTLRIAVLPASSCAIEIFGRVDVLSYLESIPVKSLLEGILSRNVLAVILVLVTVSL